MDPVSISASVAAMLGLIWNASCKLCTVVNQTANVDRATKDLASEVIALTQSLNGVHSFLTNHTSRAAEDQDLTEESRQLWQTIRDCLEECESRIVRLDLQLCNVRQVRWEGMRRRVEMQIRLMLRTDEINSLRMQFRMHSTALGTALQLASIHAAYIGSENVITTLKSNMNQLQDSLNNLENQIASRNQERLCSIGTRILSQAATVYSTSVGGASVFDGPYAALNPTAEWRQNVSYGSLLSIPATDQSRPSQSYSEFSSNTSVMGIGSDVPQIQPSPKNTDSDYDDDLEMTNEFLDTGKTYFSKPNYKDSLRYLELSVEKSTELPHHLRIQINLSGVPLMIATCKYYLNYLSEARDELIALESLESTSNNDAVQQCQVSYLLSQVYLASNELDDSERYCLQAKTGREKLLQKDQPDYFKTINLLSHICRLRGKVEIAEYYSKRVPDDSRIPLKLLLPNTEETESVSETCLADDPTSPPNRQELRDLTQHRPLKQLPSCTLRVGAFIGDFAFSPSGRRLVSSPTGRHLMPIDSLAKGSTKCWNLDTGAFVTLVDSGLESVVEGVYLTDDLMVTKGGRISPHVLWNADTGARYSVIDHKMSKDLFAPRKRSHDTLSPDDNLRADYDDHKSAIVITDRSNKVVIKTKQKVGKHYLTRFSPNGKRLAIGFEVLKKTTGAIEVFDVTNGRQITTLPIKTGKMISRIDFSGCGRFMVAQVDSNTTKLWDLQAQETTHAGKSLKDFNDFFCFSADSSYLAAPLASTPRNQQVGIWDVTSGEHKSTLGGHRGQINWIEFSPNGYLVATASSDATVKLWNVTIGLCLATLEGHGGSVNMIAFSPDGTKLATSSDDYTINIWPVPQTLYKTPLQRRLNSSSRQSDTRSLSRSGS